MTRHKHGVSIARHNHGVSMAWNINDNAQA